MVPILGENTETGQSSQGLPFFSASSCLSASPVVRSLKPQLHTHKGLPALQAQLVPGFGSGEEGQTRALGQP